MCYEEFFSGMLTDSVGDTDLRQGESTNMPNRDVRVLGDYTARTFIGNCGLLG
jgi:hypothetical protein